MNKTLLAEKETFRGFFECVVTPTLMTQQTVEFLYENYELRYNSITDKVDFIHIQMPPREVVQRMVFNANGELCIRIYSSLKSSDDIEGQLGKLLKILESLSLCVDITLNCGEISFIDHNAGSVFQALRKPIGRGVGFEVEERALAKGKIEREFDATNAMKDQAAVKHYLTGINLLGLEDQFPGLIEAAFMQFYLGCEAICKTTKCEEALMRIAEFGTPDNREMQIITHHIWQVRHTYFGHSSQNRFTAIGSEENGKRVSKQVLVARYICRRLIDVVYSTSIPFIREINIFADGYAVGFNGNIDLLHKEFYIDYGAKKVRIYEKGKGRSFVEEYIISEKS